MSEAREQQDARFHIEIAADKMKATLVVEPDHGVDIPVGDVFTRIKKLGIRGFDDGAILVALAERNGAGLSLEIVQGQPPSDPEPDTIEWIIVPGDAMTGDFAKVDEGQQLATVHAGKAGADGYDVFKRPLFAKARDQSYLGPGVAVRDDKLIATRSGGFNIHQGVASVRPIVEIDANHVSATAARTIDGDLHVIGTITQKQRVQVTGCMIVDGGIEGTSFKSGEWTHIRDRIDGGEKIKGIIGGDLSCAGARGVRLNVAGNVEARGAIIDSILFSIGRVNCGDHDIRGGQIVANGGIVCRTLGSADGIPTIVEVGVDGPLRDTLDEARPMISTYQQQLAAAQDRVKPLMTASRLTAKQKERVTEMLYEIDELQQSTQKKLGSLTQRCHAAQAAATAEVRVAEAIHPGVVIRFLKAEVQVDECITGPVRLYARTDSTGSSVVCEDVDGNVRTLRSVPREDQYSKTVDNLLHMGDNLKHAT